MRAGAPLAPGPKAQGAGASAASPLDREADNSPGPERSTGRASSGPNGTPGRETQGRKERRSEAWRWRRSLWDISSLERVRKCGRVTFTGVGGPIARVLETDAGRRAGLAGLQSCGSPWACPVCSRRIAHRRSRDVRLVTEAVAEANGDAVLATFTMRHRPGQGLRELWDGLSTAWGKVTSGSGWTRDKAGLGILGWARAVEATHGENGWHVHVHAVFYLDEPTSAEMVETYAERMFIRWERGLAKHGLTATYQGMDVRKIKLNGDSASIVAEYLNKISAEIGVCQGSWTGPRG